MSLNTKIKSLFFLGFFVFVSFWLIQPAKAIEHIAEFDSQILLEKDGGILVTEKISYDFSNESKHGIYRDIDLVDNDGNTLVVEIKGVKDELGEKYNFTTTQLSKDTLRIKIGDPEVMVSGVKNYFITYKAYNAIRVFEDHDELYWNVTGNGWDVSIAKASATITLSGLATSSVDIKQECFTGGSGSTEKNCILSKTGLLATYSTQYILGNKEGMTIVFGIPHGLLQVKNVPIAQNGFKEKIFSVLSSIIIIFIVFIFLFSIFFRKYSRVKKPKELKNISIVAEYEPPENMRPLEMGYLIDRSVDGLDVSATIIDLAVKGYLKIKYLDKVAFLGIKSKDFELEKLKPVDEKINNEERIVFEFLFGDANSVCVSELSKRFGRVGLERVCKIQSLSKDLKVAAESKMQELGYLDKQDRDKAGFRGVLTVIFFAIFGFSVHLSNGVLQNYGWAIFIVFVLAIIFLVWFFNSFSLKLTIKGIDVLAKIFGFKDFLEVVEKDRIKFFNAPGLKPETFEKFLPYAMVLKVEKEWAEKFKDIYVTQPNWYDGGAGNAFNSQILATNLILFNTSFNRSIATGNASSGFSGGSSGGGSGGGGGGSW